MDEQDAQKEWWFPENGWVSGTMWAIVSAVVGMGLTVVGTLGLGTYGWALFGGVPLVLGMVTPVLHGMKRHRGFVGLVAVNLASLVMLYGGLFLCGVEGVGCMIMCAPIWVTASMVGTVAGFCIHEAQWRSVVGGRGFPVAAALLVASLPVWMGAERAGRREPELIEARTSVEIDAPPLVVWERVVAFPRLEEPREWIFSLGVAYPTHAVIEGRGVGAVRHCQFSTGSFVEPVTVWEPGKKLAFDVTESAPSMREVSLYDDVRPPHVEGYLVSRRGQFVLVDLGNGRTRLEGTTWYTNEMYPAGYWRLWSDEIIHTIHRRVLGHVKVLSEADAGVAAGRTGGQTTLEERMMR